MSSNENFQASKLTDVKEMLEHERVKYQYVL